MVRWIAAVLVLAPLPAVADEPDPEPPPAGSRQVEGTWKLVRYEVNGEDWLTKSTTPVWKVGKDVVQTVRVRPGGKEMVVNTYQLRIDRTKRPCAFDLCQDGKALWLGSYKLAGNRWELVFASAGNPRPTAFTSKGTYLVVMQRQKR